MTLPNSTDIVPLHQYNGSPSQYGECYECGKVRSSPCWCVSCETTSFKKDFDKWTSGNTFLDDIIRMTQSHATESMAYFEWIPYENFVQIEQIASGSFSTVCLAYWLEGPRWIWDDESENWLRNGPTKCALKKIGNSSEISSAYLNNISNYYKCIQSGSVADFFGITCDPEGCYMFVMRFYENGNLYQYLDDAMGYLCWRDIVDMLWGIANGLERIHDHGLYHGNLHGGNLLVENEPESIDTRIADVGLHGPPSREINSINYGVLPFIAPEILKGNEYTQASDIYSFGIIMWTLSTCIRPFCQVPHDSELALKICNGYRPEVVDGTPEVYSTLMKKCWDNDPNKRPKASELSDILGSWVTDICDNPDPTQISEQFDAAEEKKFLDLENKQFTKPEVHPLAIYNSKLIHFSLNYTSFNGSEAKFE